MHFQQLTMENFKSFHGKHVLNFNDYGPGLHFLAGRNEVEPDLGANGAGKSTIWDCLSWVLYGKTLRSLKAGNVRTWKTTKGCQASVIFDCHDKTYRVNRTWNPNTLTLAIDDEQARPVDQLEIDNLIVLTHESFQHAITIGQFSNMFFDLPPAQKLLRFSEVLDLDYWIGRSKFTSEKAHEIDDKLRRAEERKNIYEGQLMILKRSIQDNKKLSRGYEKNRREAVKAHEKGIATKRSSLVHLQKDTKRLLDILTQLNTDFTESEDELKAIEIASTGLVDKITEVRARLLQLQSEETNLTDTISQLREVGGVCSYCRQKVDKEHIEKELTQFSTKVQSVRKKAANERELLKRILTEQTDYNEIRSDIVLRCQKLNTEIQEQSHQKQEINYGTKTLQIDIEHMTNDIKMKEEEENPFDSIIRTEAERFAETQKKSKTVSLKINKNIRFHEALTFWIKGFKDVRLMLIDEALIALEVEVNNYLIEFGLRDWAVTFDVERETKSGGISKGFQILIHSPYNKEPVPWEAWSGGESQRLRLAGTMGLASLILSAKGVTSNIEVFDEPSRHLSSEGIEDLTALLSQLARDTDKQIWLVDHCQYDAGAFDSITTIVKTTEGSYIMKDESVHH